MIQTQEFHQDLEVTDGEGKKPFFVSNIFNKLHVISAVVVADPEDEWEALVVVRIVLHLLLWLVVDEGGKRLPFRFRKAYP